MSTNRSKSRKKSPWDDLSDITVIQEYLQMHYVARYEQRHPKIKDSGEAELINSFQPNKCPFCETTDFILNYSHQCLIIASTPKKHR